MQAVDSQRWDPSVKALTQFPSVLGNLAAEPYLDFIAGRGVSHAVSRRDGGSSSVAGESIGCRQLEIRAQLSVVQQSPQVIVIQPVNPQVVYVPVYNPTVVYGHIPT